MQKLVKSDRTVVQLNLAIAMLFLHASNLCHDVALQNSRSCEIIAGLIHYFLLATGKVLDNSGNYAVVFLKLILPRGCQTYVLSCLSQETVKKAHILRAELQLVLFMGGCCIVHSWKCANRYLSELKDALSIVITLLFIKYCLRRQRSDLYGL